MPTTHLPEIGAKNLVPEFTVDMKFMTMTYILEIGAENGTRQPAPDSGASAMQFCTEFSSSSFW